MDKIEDVAADGDLDAKETLWEAIRRLANEMQKKWNMKACLGSEMGGHIGPAMPRPPALTLSKLVEILSVFVVLRDAESVRTRCIENLVGRISEPILFVKEGKLFYLWTQARMAESLSGFTGIPDITVTTTDAFPSRENAVDIIEVKSGKISSRLIRQEFAKEPI